MTNGQTLEKIQLREVYSMQFMVRVEIHGADGETYHRLHSAMAVESLIRIVTGTKYGKSYYLPIGTYWTETSGDAWTVLKKPQSAPQFRFIRVRRLRFPVRVRLCSSAAQR